MGKATHEDANLILRLYELRREEKLRRAREWFAGSFRPANMSEFRERCPPGSEQHAHYRMVTSYWDMAALFVVEGVLDEELFIRSAPECLLVWERVRPFIGEMREVFKNPNHLRNLEIVGRKQAEELDRSAPGAYEAFLERTRPR